MSEDDEGVYVIRFVLDDGTYLLFRGSVDRFCIGHCTADDEDVYLPMADLLKEMNDESIGAMFD